MSRLAGLLARRRSGPPDRPRDPAAPSPAPRRPGEPPPLAPEAELLPGYRVITHLGRGRSFDVYEVWSSERHCSCVAKTPWSADGDGDDEFARGLLRREGELLVGFTHPHLVRAYEIIEHPRLAVILETLEGQTLEHLIHEQRESIPPVGLACLGLHLCSALAYLHRHDLLHLDLKPANIVSDAGRAKLIDLSGARPPGHAPRGLGTAAYLAPEQALGDELTPAADVWGIGMVLHEAVTGCVAFGDSAEGQHYAQLERRIRLPGAQRHRLPGALAATIDACLDPDPRARPDLDRLEETFDKLA